MDEEITARNSSEGGDDYSLRYDVALSIVLATFTFVVSVVTVLGNLLVMLAFFLDHHLRQPGNYFIASLALTDFVIGLSSMPGYTMYLLLDETWPFSALTCDIWLGTDYTLCLVSQYTVLWITVDRFCLVKFPAQYKQWLSQGRAKIVVAITWAVSMMIFYTTIIGWQYFVGRRDVPPQKCYTQFSTYPIFNTVFVICYYWVTLAVIFVLYIMIYRVALRMHRQSEARRNNTILQLHSRTPRAGGGTDPNLTVGNLTVRTDNGSDDGSSYLDEASSSNDKTDSTPLTERRNQSLKRELDEDVSLLESGRDRKRNDRGHKILNFLRRKVTGNRLDTHRRLSSSISLPLKENGGANCPLPTSASTALVRVNICGAAINADPDELYGIRFMDESESMPSLVSVHSIYRLARGDVDGELVLENPNAGIMTGPSRAALEGRYSRGENSRFSRGEMGGYSKYNRAMSRCSRNSEDSFPPPPPPPVIITTPVGSSIRHMSDKSRASANSKNNAGHVYFNPSCADPLEHRKMSTMSSLRRHSSRVVTLTSVIRQKTKKLRPSRTRKLRLSVNKKKCPFGRLLTQEKRERRKEQKKNAYANRAQKALRTITFILGVFVLTWTPYHVLTILYGFCNSCVPPRLFEISYWLCYLNSPINPICYALVNQQFKRAFLRILRGKWNRA